MLIVLYRIYFISEKYLMKQPIYMVYIYLCIVVINALVNIILLGIVDIDTITSLISCTNNSCLEIDGPKIILKISPDNSDLVQGDIRDIDTESNKKIDSVDVNLRDSGDECKGKNRK
jgi:hypothetical protein